MSGEPRSQYPSEARPSSRLPSLVSSHPLYRTGRQADRQTARGQAGGGRQLTAQDELAEERRQKLALGRGCGAHLLLSAASHNSQTGGRAGRHSGCCAHHEQTVHAVGVRGAETPALGRVPDHQQHLVVQRLRAFAMGERAPHQSRACERTSMGTGAGLHSVVR
jgi:hypothetical protein